MARMVLIGGGTFEEIDELNRLAADMTGKKLPNALFIGTALQDSTNPLTSFKKSFKRACPGAQVKKLSIIRNTYTEAEIDALLEWADVIFVGGGNTACMIEEWQKAGLDKKLEAVLDEDRAVVSGISAGAICWFKKGYTDSAAFSGEENWDYQVMDMPTGRIDAFFCPHFNDLKRGGFESEPLLKEMKGIALEDCTAYIENEGSVSYRTVDPERHAYEFSYEGGQLFKKQMC